MKSFREDFLVALKEENPWYYSNSPWGGPITYHPLIDDAPMVAAMHRYQYPFGFVHAKQETEFINPLPLGKPASITTKLDDKYEKGAKVTLSSSHRTILKFHKSGFR